MRLNRAGVPFPFPPMLFVYAALIFVAGMVAGVTLLSALIVKFGDAVLG